ncbi:uncharacterized protein [Mytilus edulis]|uniref:uncharacterized protein n=1 Tax=Mytilus edulis TaxID=6550 RepID=UPI0039EF9D38
MVQEFDFISLVETKTDDLDKINIPGFTFHLKNRKNIARVKSGGIAFGYKSHLENFVKPVENFSSLVYWWKISSDLLKTDQDVMIGNIYIPPENSVYKVPDAFNELEQEFLKFSVEYKYILLNGDFNSRTSRDVEYIETVHSQHDIVDTDNVDILNNLELYDMSKVRCSMDTSKNSYGNMLLEMCKNNNIIILNGRVNGDKEGKFTCRQASVVDYFICTYDFLCFVVNMYVQDFSKLFSDVHSPLILSLNFKDGIEEDVHIAENSVENAREVKRVQKWDVEKKNEFVEFIDKNKISDLVAELESVDSNLLSQGKINEVVENINSIFLDAAENVLGTYNASQGSRTGQKMGKKGNKPWFDKQCWNKRKIYRGAKRNYSSNRSEAKREEMKKKEREYKRQMDKSMREYRKKFQKHMKNLRTKNPKEYWKILNRGGKRTKPNIALDVLFDFFKNLNNAENTNDVTNEPNDIQGVNEVLNSEITTEEISKCIRDLKNGKASGDDLIINEFMKSTSHIFIPVYVKLFNMIFDSGILPDIWLMGNIIPFYKNKGDQSDPQNYRPITILSCLGKLFTSVLNLRLSSFLEDYLLLNENQAGFRKGYSTVDNIFVIHILFELLKRKKKKLYCAFVDFAKAFDTVWRSGLWSKLIKHSINGKMYNVIVNMYNNIKSRIHFGSDFSEFFPCSIGVRQGENLSPLLFSIYLNDLELFLQNKNIEGLCTISDELEIELNVYLKLFVILYADDTVLMAESQIDLQRQLDSLYEYCELWKLRINSLLMSSYYSQEAHK